MRLNKFYKLCLVSIVVSLSCAYYSVKTYAVEVDLGSYFESISIDSNWYYILLKNNDTGVYYLDILTDDSLLSDDEVLYLKRVTPTYMRYYNKLEKQLIFKRYIFEDNVFKLSSTTNTLENSSLIIVGYSVRATIIRTTYTSTYPADAISIGSVNAFKTTLEDLITVSYDEGDDDTPAEDQPWYLNLMDKINGMFDGMLSGLTGTFSDIASGLASMSNKIQNVWASIKALPGQIGDYIGGKLTFLFTPTISISDEVSSALDDKIAFITEIKDASNLLTGTLGGSGVMARGVASPPDVTITAYGTKVKIIDFSIYDQYRSWIHGIILALAWFAFIRKLFYRVPAILGGFGVTEEGSK